MIPENLNEETDGGLPAVTCWAVWLRWTATIPLGLLVLAPCALIGMAGYAISDLIDNIAGKTKHAGRRMQVRRNHWVMTGTILSACPECGSFRRIDNGAACGSCGIDLPNDEGLAAARSGPKTN